MPVELEVFETDLQVGKTGFSAFFPGKCDLHGILQAKAIDTIVLCGFVTNICCESSARDAVELGYKTVLIGDLCIGPRDERQDASLKTFFRSFGDVRSVDCMTQLLQT